MNMNTTINIFKAGRLLVITFAFFALLFLNATTASATGSFGWFSPKVEYLNETSACPGKASIEFQLVEKNTQNQITNPIGIWSIAVRDSSLTVLSTQNLNGQKVSSVVCFNPSTDGFQIKVNDSDSYHGFTGPTILPSGSAADLNTMIGKHFRGYLQLESMSNSVPFIEAISPNGAPYSGIPTFQVKNNSITNLYGVTGVKSTKLFIVNQTDTTTSYTQTIPTPSAANTITTITPNPTIIPSNMQGIFYWSFIQDLNGTALTKKLTSPAYQWTFSSIPSSGAPDVLSFTIDKSAPTSVINTPVIASVSPLSITVNNVANDALSGLASTRVYIKKADGTPLANSLQSIAPNTFSYDANFTFTGGGLVQGQTYLIYAVTIDNVGNSIITPEVSYTIPTTLAVPTLTNLTATSTTPPQYTFRAVISDTGGSSIVARGTCWTLDSTLAASAFIGNPSATCIETTESPARTTNFAFSDNHNSIPTGSQIYYMAYAKNATGIGYTVVNNFGSAPSFSVVPTVKFETASDTIESNKLDPGLRILHTGGLDLSRFGICMFGTAAARDSFTYTNNAQIVALNASVPNSCKAWGVAKPTSFVYRNLNTNLLAGQTYYFKVFAVNANGMGEDIGQITTPTKEYYFKHRISESPKFNILDSDFNTVSNQYNNVRVQVVAVDGSSELDPLVRRDVSFTARLDSDNDGSFDDGTIVSTVTTHYPNDPFTSAYAKEITFTNVPLGLIRVEVTINEPDTFVPAQTNNTNRTLTAETVLKNPNFSIDNISGDETSSGSGFVVDPQLSLSVTPSIIRSGESTNLNWSMLNVNGDLSCRIAGPTSFDGDGVYTFTHTYIATNPATISGSISSGALFSTQKFEFSCNDTASGLTYSTTTRVTVLGSAQEI